MSFIETVERARALLERNGRLSLRALQREFDLGDETLADLVEELVDVQHIAAREGKVLSWIGAAPAEAPAPEPETRTTLEAASEPTVEAERRQLTVLFCDLVNSTRLAAGLDPEDWREVVVAYYKRADEVVARFGGHVAQHLGDGILVYFGYPRAHEDDAERATRAGLGIVGAVGVANDALEESHGLRLAVRVGIHTGLVVIGEVNDGERRETLALGDTTNLAARVQGEAEADTVVMSAATLRLVSGIFVTEDLGERALKGVGEVRLHRALRPSGMRSRLDVASAMGLTPLVARDQELALLEDRFAQVMEGLGQAVLISGEAGIGKSRLMQAFRERLAERAHSWLECRCSPYTQDSPLFPVIQLLQQSLGFRRGDAPEAKLERIEVGLAAAGFDLAQTMPLMASFHGLPLPERYEEPVLSPEGRRRNTHELLAEWLLHLGRLQSLVLLMEDLHWVDASTRELLGRVLERIPREQVLLLATYRPDFEAPWGARSHVTPMLLSRLTRAQLGELIRKAAAGRNLPDAWVEEILRRSDGVPLFAEELTKTVLESNPDPSRDGDLPELRIPETLKDSLMARLDQLGPVKELAQLAAVLGREFSYDLLLKVSPVKEAELQSALERAVREELFYQRGTPPDASYLFKHALIRDAAYESLLRSTRQRHHGRVAETLIEQTPDVVSSQPELVAHHLTEAGETGQAVAYWLRAGEQAVARVANEEAISHLNRGLDLVSLLPEDRERDRQELLLQVALGPPVIAAEGYASPDVERAYLRAEALCTALAERRHTSQVLYGLSSHYATLGQFRKSAEVAARLLSAGEETEEAGQLMWGHVASGFSMLYGPSVSRGVAHLERAIDLYEPSVHQPLAYAFGQEPGVVARSFCAQALWHVGYPERALQRVHEAIELGRESGHPHSLAFGLFYAAVVRQFRREFDKIPPLAEELIAVSQEQHFPLWSAMGDLLRSWTRVVSRSHEGSLEKLGECFGRLATTGTALGAPYFFGLLGESNVSVGQWDKALGAIHAALAVSAQQESGFWDAELYRQKGEILLQMENHADDGAEALFRNAIGIAQGQEAKSLELRAATSLARLWQHQGKMDLARDLLQPVYDWFTEGLDTRDLLDAKTLLEQLA